MARVVATNDGLRLPILCWSPGGVTETLPASSAAAARRQRELSGVLGYIAVEVR
jgi:hypothetical protein